MSVLAALAVILAATPADAQMGRQGFTWQTEIQLAREELAQLQADLDRLSREAWNKRSLAWLQVEIPGDAGSGDRRLRVSESWRVRDLLFKKKTKVRALDEGDAPSRWEVEFAGKPQRKLGVVMTDGDGTRVVCPLGEVLEGGGALGVFRHAGVLVCFARQPESD